MTMNQSSASEQGPLPGGSTPELSETPDEYPDVGDVSNEAAEEDEVRAALGIVGAATPDAAGAEQAER